MFCLLETNDHITLYYKILERLLWVNTCFKMIFIQNEMELGSSLAFFS